MKGLPVIAIGLEAADPDLLIQWCDEGKLPFFSELLSQGSWCRLASPTEISSGATWPSIITGTNPGSHGMGFYHRQLKSGTYTIRKKYADEMGQKPFWFYLSNEKRIAVLDIPDIYPAPLNGVHLISWGAEAPNWKMSSWPPEFLKKILQKYGQHPLSGWYQKRPSDFAGWKDLLDRIVAGIKLRTSLARDVLKQEPWDLFFMSYAEPHWAGHLYWHLMDVNCPQYDADAALFFKDAILQVYSEIDRSLAQLVDDVENINIMVFSNTGMGPNLSGVHLVDEVLKNLGMRCSASKEKFGSKLIQRFSPAQKWGASAIRNIEKKVSAKNIEKVKKIIPTRIWDSWTRRFLNWGHNWENSIAFAVPNDYTGAIRINLKGREPKGVVEPTEYDQFCEKIAGHFKALINPETGRKAVRSVLKVREVYPGKEGDELPDLIIHWVDEAPIRSLRSSEIGTVSGDLPDERTGSHKKYGFMISCGSAFLTDTKISEATLMDIAPTILSLLGEALPQHLEGKPLLSQKPLHPARIKNLI